MSGLCPEPRIFQPPLGELVGKFGDVSKAAYVVDVTRLTGIAVWKTRTDNARLKDRITEKRLKREAEFFLGKRFFVDGWSMGLAPAAFCFGGW